MRFGIVEGEPGIFPDPIARLLRLRARLIRRALRLDDPEPPTAGQPDRPSQQSPPAAPPDDPKT